MNDFFGRLADRSSRTSEETTTPFLLPRLPSLFEPAKDIEVSSMEGQSQSTRKGLRLKQQPGEITKDETRQFSKIDTPSSGEPAFTPPVSTVREGNVIGEKGQREVVDRSLRSPTYFPKLADSLSEEIVGKQEESTRSSPQTKTRPLMAAKKLQEPGVEIPSGENRADKEIAAAKPKLRKSNVQRVKPTTGFVSRFIPASPVAAVPSTQTIQREQVVHVHIGRIDVRAIAAPPQTSVPRVQGKAKSELDDYLSRRNGKR